jgi:hypothetical protein
MSGSNKIVRSLHFVTIPDLLHGCRVFFPLQQSRQQNTERQQDSKEIADECKEKILDAMTTKFVNFEIGAIRYLVRTLEDCSLWLIGIFT